MNKKWIVPSLYILFLMLPIYGLISMSFKTTNEILGGFSFFPQNFTLENYITIFTDPTWYNGYINSLIYVCINTVITISVALPAAYAFSRYRFLGDKHLFFWLLTNRMAPPAVFALPFFQLYSAIELFDTHLAVALAHCLFNSHHRCRHRCRRILLLHVFLGGTAACQDIDIGKRQAYCSDHDANGEHRGLRTGAAGGRRIADYHTRSVRHLFRAQLYRQGLCHGTGLRP